MSEANFAVGDHVWVRTRAEATYEEPAIIQKLHPANEGGENLPGRPDWENGSTSCLQVSVKYTTSGIESVVATNCVRPMAAMTPLKESDGRRRSLRSRRPLSASCTSLVSGAVTATPSPTLSHSSSTEHVSDDDVKRCEEALSKDDKHHFKIKEESEDALENAKKRNRHAFVSDEEATPKKKAKKHSGAKTGNPSGRGNKNSSPYFSKSENCEEKSSPYFAPKSIGATEVIKDNEKNKPNPNSRTKNARARKLILPASEDETNRTADDDKKEKKSREQKAKKILKEEIPIQICKEITPINETGGNQPKARKNLKKNTSTSPAQSNDQVSCEIPNDGEPDGNGGLNQPSPFRVEYSTTGRATCRTCDERIMKGELRVGHTPSFRGKPGYMVFRHLRCVVFSDDINSPEDVANANVLNKDDYQRLVEQVEVSKEKIKEEMDELEPDELVHKSFDGEIRPEPPRLTATLLPFQVEGFSWMRNQEVNVKEIRGGILADEMGMGKTLQTIATILDNRPKLQHSKPKAKHPPSANLEEMRKEEDLWDKSRVDWQHEMDMLKVSKKIRSRDGGARAGTLVICPVIALSQWRTEIEKFSEDGALSICTYHGPDRETQTPRGLMSKYDVVLTTYQVLEADFRKMTSPNRVECPNCGGKFKIDKLPIHLKYFCGDGARRTEAQARQRRNSDREDQHRTRRNRPANRPPAGGRKKDANKEHEKKVMSKKRSKKKQLASDTEDDAPKRKTKQGSVPGKKVLKSKPSTVRPSKVPERSGTRRNAALKAASQISQSASEWIPPDIDSNSDNYISDSESSSEEDLSDDEMLIRHKRREQKYKASEDDDPDCSSSEDSALVRARAKQKQALELTKNSKRAKKTQVSKSKANKKSKADKKSLGAKKGHSGKRKNRKGTPDGDDDDSSASDLSDRGEENNIDMDLLVREAMAGAKNSVLHSLCWWRIVLDEAHMIKTRSSQTANAAFSLIGIHRWCLSGTPLQNRVGEFYSLVRFLRLDPMAFYFCRLKDCDCKSMHYRIVAGKCEGCGHGGVHHYSHFNRYVLNPIQRDGYSGDGRRAMFTLKNEVLDRCLLRRTKETKAEDMELPPRLVQIKPVRLHPVEEDFYGALYTQTKSSFNDYVDSGTLLNNYAHIFDLLIRMRQSVDHPYLVIYSNKRSNEQANASQSRERLAISNGSVDCDICHEPPTDRVVSTCCGSAYCRACVVEYMAASNTLAASASLLCPSCRRDFSIDLETKVVVEDDSVLDLNQVESKRLRSEPEMPSLKELPHVATGSILRRINLAEYATSSKIEALTQELVNMRQTSPGSKAIVFSQFVNMLDLIRWRLHSDPYLEDIGLGARALHGGMNVKARDECLKEFRENNDVRVLLMSLKAGGVALNLTCANFIFLMDPWWNPAAEMQAIDRTHRLGQYRPIHAIRFIAENTVEERILQLQEKKRLVFDGTVGRDAGSLKMLTVDDMKSLFA